MPPELSTQRTEVMLDLRTSSLKSKCHYNEIYGVRNQFYM